MTAAHASQIIDGYLRRLDAEMSNLPPGRRKELHGQIAEHIDQARSELSEETDADLLTILDRLGEPDEIVAAARSALALPAGNPGPLEIVALVLIGVGGVVFPVLPVPWLFGTVLVWRSRSWTPRQKYFGAYLPLVTGLAILLITALVGGLFGRHVVFEASALGLVVANLLMPLGTAVYLGTRLGRRLPILAWSAIAILGLAVYVPAASALIPAQKSAFIGTPFDQPGHAPVAGQPGCGGFYGTVRYATGTPLVATAPVSVGLCWDGARVTKTWGPDCYPEGGPGLLVRVQSCTVEHEPDGSVIISITTSASALTAPFFTQSGGFGWRITPDGRVDGF
jgi:HAAS domain-containing protein